MIPLLPAAAFQATIVPSSVAKMNEAADPKTGKAGGLDAGAEFQTTPVGVPHAVVDWPGHGITTTLEFIVKVFANVSLL